MLLVTYGGRGFPVTYGGGAIQPVTDGGDGANAIDGRWAANDLSTRSSLLGQTRYEQQISWSTHGSWTRRM